MPPNSPMTGFPPAPATQVSLANWRTAPFNAWAFHHVREIVPSAEIDNAADDVWPLPEAKGALDGLTHAGESLDTFLAETQTDGFVVLHCGKIVAESYGNGMHGRSPHILMSVSKSVLGTLAGILAAAGTLDPEAPVTHYVPEVAATAWRGARVRHLLDMRVGIRFDENYEAVSGAIIEYRKAQGWNPLDPGERPSDLRSFFGTLHETDGPHEGRFHYVSPNTDLLGWVMERASGVRYADLASRLLWQPMGAECPAYITVDRFGAPRCAGGICTTTRDLARLGELLVRDGVRDGRRVLPAGWVGGLIANGDRAAWDNGDFVGLFPGQVMHYRSKWYIAQGKRPMIFGLGVNGQNLFADPEGEVVVAKFSSQSAALDPTRITRTMEWVETIRAHLAG